MENCDHGRAAVPFIRFAFFAACVSARVTTGSRSDAETLVNHPGNIGVFYRLNELIKRSLFFAPKAKNCSKIVLILSMNSKPVDFAPGRAEKKVIVQRGRHRPRWLHEPRERQLNSVFSLRPPIRSQKYFRGGFACGDCRHCLRVCGQPNLAPGSGAHAKLFPG